MSPMTVTEYNAAKEHQLDHHRAELRRMIAAACPPQPAIWWMERKFIEWLELEARKPFVLITPW